MDGTGQTDRTSWLHNPILPTAHVHWSDPAGLSGLRRQLGDAEFSAVSIFATPEADFDGLMQEAAKAFGGAAVIGCTTAGEIAPGGYVDGEIVAVGFPADHFETRTIALPDLDIPDQDEIVRRINRARSDLATARPQWSNEFAFLMVDGLSRREDALIAAITPGLGTMPLFGGSAGDGVRFEQTLIHCGDHVLHRGAVLTLVRTACPVRVFTLDHLRPTGTRMVVTEANPEARTVSQINAEPAAREYARLLGKDPEQLTAFTFAAHPVVVRFGDEHHVRAIQRVAENGDLVFFSAIDEGLVLTLADPEDMVAHLDRELAAMRSVAEPVAILACDCLLRRMEAQQKQVIRGLSTVLSANRVVGFSTYGEQFGPIHVNQTMTGVAIYPPGADLP